MINYYLELTLINLSNFSLDNPANSGGFPDRNLANSFQGSLETIIDEDSISNISSIQHPGASADTS